MSSNSEIILSQQSYTGDNTVETVAGTPSKGDGFYGRSDGIHTVQYSITDFTGTVIIQATLAAEPLEEDWFRVYEQSYPGLSAEPTTTSKIANFTGNYVWVRAKIVYTGGVVNSILLNH
jgi:hypothetical protein